MQRFTQLAVTARSRAFPIAMGVHFWVAPCMRSLLSSAVGGILFSVYLPNGIGLPWNGYNVRLRAAETSPADALRILRLIWGSSLNSDYMTSRQMCNQHVFPGPFFRIPHRCEHTTYQPSPRSRLWLAFAPGGDRCK